MSPQPTNSHTSTTSDPNASFATSSHEICLSESHQAHSQHKMEGHDQNQLDLIGPAPAADDLGQFSFAPTTRTTVVTTTTTTTTSFPPLAIKPPRAVQDLDLRQYPLAASPTPASLRKLQFQIGGRSIAFHEPEDSAAASTEVKERNAALKASNGVIHSVNSFTSEDEVTPRQIAPPATSRINLPNPQIRPVSPVSIPEPRPSILPRLRGNRVPSEPISRRTRHGPSNTFLSPGGLATPETEQNVGSIGDAVATRQRTHSANLPRRETTLLRSPLSADTGAVNTLQNSGAETGELQGPPADSNGASEPDSAVGQASSFIAPERTSNRLDLSTQLSAIDNAMAQDMCLPSPSLSPVTAMNALHAESPFGYPEEPDVDTDSSFDHSKPRSLKRVRMEDESSRNNAVMAAPTARSPASLMDMPRVLEFFDSVPEELKTYMMYQFLRRCPKPTLHFVADVVNPALKCDFISNLPLELSLNIIQHFDVKTMCRAAQVSRRWRHIVNSDEKTWKALLDQDGYVLPEGELVRAIKEGWGWQCSSPDNWERDLSVTEFKEDQPSSSFYPAPFPVEPRRCKRKANSRGNSRKQAKRKISTSGGDSPKPDWKKEIAAFEAPYAAANAAAAAVTYPEVGLPSLRGLYLFKAIYRRLHAIRQGWIKPEVKPQHIAFRAHDRHVVTCLQFDSNKILTGSDDTNINVYDTKTGTLNATLEGHEGGVWALEYYGNTLVSGSTDRSVRVWDIERKVCTQVFHGHTSTVRCLQIVLPTEVGQDANGRAMMMPKVPLIITGSRDSNLRVWKLPTRNDPAYLPVQPTADDHDCPYFVRVLSGHTHSVRAIAAHGDTLVSGSYDCSVRVWKISTGHVKYVLTGHTLKVYSVVLDNERNRCISGAMDHMVKIWSLDNGALLYNLDGHTSLVGLLSLQGDHLVSAAADSTLRIWDPERGHCKNTLSAHTGAITCFQHDSQKVISGSDRTLKMWDVTNGNCVRDLLTDLSGVWQVKFNERRCVAAVQRDSLTYIEVLDFGAARDGVPENNLGRRIAVNRRGVEIVARDDSESSDSDAAF